MFLLLLRETAISVQLCAIESILQPLHQPLLLVQLHFQLSQGELELTLLLTQRHHLQETYSTDQLTQTLYEFQGICI